jgi:hypothetical protein
MCNVVEDAWRRGAKFDNWTDLFDPGAWQEAFISHGLEQEFYTSRGYSLEEILPWDNIDMGISRDLLISQHNKAARLINE